MTDITQDINYSKVVWEQLRRWRIVRDPILKLLDIEFIKALETDDVEAKSIVVAKKQALRDVTNYDFSSLDSIEDILGVWPDILGDVPDEFRITK